MFKAMLQILAGIMLVFAVQLLFGFGNPIATIDVIFAQIYAVVIVGIVTFVEWVEEQYSKKKETL